MRLNLVCGGVLATVLKIKRHYAEVMPCVCRPVLILTVTESLLRSLQSIPNVTIRTVRLRYPGRVRLSERSQQSSGLKFEFFRHLGHYAPWGGLKPTFREYLSAHIKGSRRPCWTFWPLNMGPVCSSESSVSNGATPRNNTEDNTSFQPRREPTIWGEVCFLTQFSGFRIETSRQRRTRELPEGCKWRSGRRASIYQWGGLTLR